MSFEEWLAEIVRNKGVKLSEIARKTGVRYPSLYASLFDRKKERELRSSELIAVCRFLSINPMDFADEEKGE